MKFAIWIIALLALLVGVPLIFEGIRTNDPGFWLFVGFVIVGAIAMHWKLGQLNRNKAAREADDASRPLKGFGDGDL